jgi:pyruvate dehydrogenase E1 component
MFSAAGWQVIDVKFGRRLEALFKRAGGPQLRRRILDMPNPEYNDCCDAAQTSCEHGCPATAPEPMKSPVS